MAERGPPEHRDKTMFGRDGELSRVVEALRSSLSGRKRVVLVTGEPGIGKTRLATAAAAVARTEGARVLWWRASATPEPPDLWPWAQLIRAYVDDVDHVTLAAQLGGTAADVAELVPELVHRLPGLALLEERSTPRTSFRVCDAVCRLLHNIARSRPLVVVLDDLHNADDRSLDLLDHLVSQTAEAGLLLVATYPQHELLRNRRLARSLGVVLRHPGTDLVELEALDGEAVEALARHTAGPADLTTGAELIATWSDGNPFFAIELTRWLLGHGPTSGRPGSSSVPASISGVVLSRVGRLTDGAGRLVTMASLMASVFSPEILEALGDVDGSSVLPELEEAVAAGLLVELGHGCFAFAHAIERAALEETLVPTRRVRFHQRAASVLAARPGLGGPVHTAALAHHHAAAAEGGDHDAVDPALALLAVAAREAAGQGDHDGGAVHLERALELAARPRSGRAVRGRLLLQLAEAYQRAGHWDRAARTFDDAAAQARIVDDWPTVGLAVVARAGDWPSPSEVRAECAALVEEALDHVGAGAGESRSPGGLVPALLATRARMRRDPAGAREAVQLARALDDPAALYRSLNAVQVSDTRLTGGQRIDLADEMVDLAVVTGRGAAEAHAQHMRVNATLAVVDREGLEIAVKEIHRLAEAEPGFGAQLPPLVDSMLALLEGRFSDAEALMGAEGGRRSPMAAEAAEAQLLAVRREQGRLPEITERVERLGSIARRPSMGDAKALLSLEAGRPEAAERALRLTYETATDAPWTLSLLAEAGAGLGGCPMASDLYRRLARHEGSVVTLPEGFLCLGAVDRFLGLLATGLGRAPVARRHFERAIQVNRRLGARPALARTQLDLAACLLVGEPGSAEAAELLAASAEEATVLGMDTLAERVRAIQRQIGAPRRQRTPTAAPLTAREVDVLRLVAQGQPNKRIARELAITEKTVKTHLGNIFAKLGVEDRTQAAVYAVRNDVLLDFAGAGEGGFGLEPAVRGERSATNGPPPLRPMAQAARGGPP